MYMYMYIHTYIHACMHACIHVYGLERPLGCDTTTPSRECVSSAAPRGPLALPPSARASAPTRALLLPPLPQQAPAPQHLVRDHHQRLLIQPRHSRRRTQPRVHPARKRRHLVLLHAEKLQRRRVAPVGGRCGQPQRLPARAQAYALLGIKPRTTMIIVDDVVHVAEQRQGPGPERAADGKHVLCP